MSFSDGNHGFSLECQIGFRLIRIEPFQEKIFEA